MWKPLIKDRIIDAAIINNTHFPNITHKLNKMIEASINTEGISGIFYLNNLPKALYIQKTIISNNERIGYISLMINNHCGITFFRAMEKICLHCISNGINKIQFKGLSSDKYTFRLYSKFAEVLGSTINESGEESLLYQLNSPYYFIKGE